MFLGCGLVREVKFLAFFLVFLLWAPWAQEFWKAAFVWEDWKEGKRVEC